MDGTIYFSLYKNFYIDQKVKVHNRGTSVFILSTNYFVKVHDYFLQRSEKGGFVCVNQKYSTVFARI
jgi:hypothetical protein